MEKRQKPIPFSTEMVRAILEGKKTVTRRIVKPQPKGTPYPMPMSSCWPHYFGQTESDAVFSPPYLKGDILWVRETWSKDADGNFVYRTNYGATEDDSFPPSMFKWRPSIHMPHDAARIFLKVTDLKIERLQGIDFEQCKVEGVWDDYKTASEKYHNILAEKAYPIVFSRIWNETITEENRKKFGWQANPWVWVIKFERV